MSALTRQVLSIGITANHSETFEPVREAAVIIEN